MDLQRPIFDRLQEAGFPVSGVTCMREFDSGDLKFIIDVIGHGSHVVKITAHDYHGLFYGELFVINRVVMDTISWLTPPWPVDPHAPSMRSL